MYILNCKNEPPFKSHVLPPNHKNTIRQLADTKIKALIVSPWCVLVTWSFGGISHFYFFEVDSKMKIKYAKVSKWNGI
jgi:hypothetical protein